MINSNFGDQDESSEITTRHIPVLAVAAVGLMLLYAVVALAGIGSGAFLIEFGAAMLMTGVGARAVVADYSHATRTMILLFGIGGTSGLLMLAGARLGNSTLALHGLVLFALCAVGWLLVIPLVEQCSGRAQSGVGQMLAKHNDAVVALVIIGTLEFCVGESLRRGYGNMLLSPTPYALAFFIAAGALVSLGKLVQRVRETPGSVRVADGFTRMWLGAMLAVLAACGFAAMILPKMPVQAMGRWTYDRVIGTPTARQPGSNTTHESPTPSHGTSPFGGWGKNGAPASRGVTPSAGGTDPLSNALDAADRVARSFETSKQTGNSSLGTGGATMPSPSSSRNDGQRNNASTAQSPDHTGTSSNGNAGKSSAQGTGTAAGGNTGKSTGQGSGSAAPNATDRAHPGPFGKSATARPGASAQSGNDKSTVSPLTPQQQQKLDKLKKTLKDNPLRLLKLVLLVLLATALFVAASLLLVGAVRRYLWALLVSLARQLGAWGRFALMRWLGPYRARRAARRREQRIQQHLTGMHPFENPFCTTPELPPVEMARAAYGVFLAYLWLLGFERRESETGFLFATRVCDTSRLEAKAVGTIAVECVRAEFSGSPLTGAELAQLRTALETIIAAITERMPDEERETKMQEYRRLLAERQVDAEMTPVTLPVTEPAPSAA